MSMFDDFVSMMSGGDVSSIPASQRGPFDMNAVGGGLSAFGYGMGAVSHLQFGIQAQRAAQFQAAQLRQNANAALAASQRDAYDVDLQTKMITSRALAVAAASGGGASDPTVLNIMAQDAARGAYLKSMALYNGQDKARQLQEQADAAEYEGKLTKRNSMIEGVGDFVKLGSSLLGTQARGASLFQRFGGNGPT